VLGEKANINAHIIKPTPTITLTLVFLDNSKYNAKSTNIPKMFARDKDNTMRITFENISNMLRSLNQIDLLICKHVSATDNPNKAKVAKSFGFPNNDIGIL
jgi:hypothetical protein